MRNNIVAPPGSETSKRQTRKFCWTRPYLIEDKRNWKSSSEFETGKKLSNQPYENTANRQPLLRHTRVDFVRPSAAATAYRRQRATQESGGSGRPARGYESGDQSGDYGARSGDLSGCHRARNFADRRYYTRDNRHVSGDHDYDRATATPRGHVPAASPAADTGMFDKNFFVDNFRKGGPIMWPILIVSLTALAVVLERIFWWLGRWMRRDPKRIEKVFTAIEVGDVAEASRLSRDSRDPVLRMMWNGLNHQHASLQGALQVAAGIEIKRAGRFLVVMDTLVTLAPLLGLLGTITGLMKSFSFLGNEELAVQAVTGGIAEALIATACGLGIAIFALIPFNFFTSRVSNLEFELQTAATNLEVMLEAQNKAGHSEVQIPGTTPTSATRSSI